MTGFGIALLASFLTSIIVLRIAHLQRSWGFDEAGGEPRKIHGNPVPRLGGAAILIAAWFAGSAINYQDSIVGGFFLALLMVSLPAFLAGLGEDLSGRLSPLTRIFGMFFAAILLMAVLNIFIVRIDIDPIDRWLLETADLSDNCLLYTSPSPRDLSTSRMPSSA